MQVHIYIDIGSVNRYKITSWLALWVQSAPAGKSYQMDHALGHHWSWTWCSSGSSDFVAWCFPETNFLALNVNQLWTRMLCAWMLIEKTASMKSYRGTDNNWARWNFKQNLITTVSTMWRPCLIIVVGLEFLNVKKPKYSASLLLYPKQKVIR